MLTSFGVYHVKVNPNLTFIQRPGYKSQTCKMVYLGKLCLRLAPLCCDRAGLPVWTSFETVSFKQSDTASFALFDTQERHRTKQLLAGQEILFPGLYHSLLTAMKPLMARDRVGLESRKMREGNYEDFLWRKELNEHRKISVINTKVRGPGDYTPALTNKVRVIVGPFGNVWRKWSRESEIWRDTHRDLIRAPECQNARTLVQHGTPPMLFLFWTATPFHLGVVVREAWNMRGKTWPRRREANNMQEQNGGCHFPRFFVRAAAPQCFIFARFLR